MTEVQVDDVAINKSGEQFLVWHDDLDKTVKSLGNINLVPGDFPDANDLKTLVKTRSEEVNTLLINVQKAIGVIGNQLKTVAKKYKDTEHDNTIVGKDLDDLVTGLNKSLPGFSKYKTD